MSDRTVQILSLLKTSTSQESIYLPDIAFLSLILFAEKIEDRFMVASSHLAAIALDPDLLSMDLGDERESEFRLVLGRTANHRIVEMDRKPKDPTCRLSPSQVASKAAHLAEMWLLGTNPPLLAQTSLEVSLEALQTDFCLNNYPESTLRSATALAMLGNPLVMSPSIKVLVMDRMIKISQAWLTSATFPELFTPKIDTENYHN